MKRLSFVAVSAFLLAALSVGTAHADQCAALSDQQVMAIAKYLTLGEKVASLCEPCGERSPHVTTIQSLEVKPLAPGDSLKVISINKREADLAYTFVNTSRVGKTAVYMNAAFLVGCPADGVSPRLVLPQ